MATEKRLIDANALLMNVIAVTNSKGQVTWSAVSTTDILTAPTVDAVEVVRCKDCKHYVLNACACRHENFNGIIHMNGFCSYGERKDNV